VENQQQRPFPKNKKQETASLTERQIEKEKQDRIHKTEQEVNAIRFAPKVCER
jgi:alanine-alpha-ketoisovalerate/valine-pyruvate aminotransferase